MSQVQRKIPQRIRIFLGCEGESERSYGTMLRVLLEEVRRDRHIDTVQLGGGDPLALVERCREHLQNTKRKNRVPYENLALLLDSDQRHRNKGRDRQALAIGKKLGIIFIWQEPCHEAFLFRHFDGKARVKISTTDDAMRKLQSVWSSYQKGMTADRLLSQIGHEHIRRAANVVPDYGAFLRTIGYLE